MGSDGQHALASSLLTTEIVFATDAGYAGPLRGTLRSLAASLSPGERCRVHLLSIALSHRQQAELAAAAAPIEINWINIDGNRLADAQNPGRSHISNATIARLHLQDLLPAHVQRVIYLDVDVLVRRSVAPLMSLDLGDKILGAVRDPAQPWFGGHGRSLPWEELGFEPTLPYFNAGVLVIDLARWRDLRVGQRAYELVCERPLRWMDQDALNLICADQWLALSPGWNLQAEKHRGERLGFAAVYEQPKVLSDAISDPAVVHFTGSDKPWLSTGRQRRYAREWLKAYEATAPTLRVDPRGFTMNLRSFTRRVRSRLRRALYVLLYG